MNDIVYDLIFTPVPYKNRDEWLHKTMVRAADEIKKLRLELIDARKQIEIIQKTS